MDNQPITPSLEDTVRICCKLSTVELLHLALKLGSMEDSLNERKELVIAVAGILERRCPTPPHIESPFNQGI